MVLLASAAGLARAQTSVTLDLTSGYAGLRTSDNSIFTGVTAQLGSDFWAIGGTAGSIPQFSLSKVIIDLGDLGAIPLNSVIIPPPVVDAASTNPNAVAGHTYAALTRFGAAWDFAVFRVTDVQNNTSVSLDYIVTNLPAPSRVLNITSNTTLNNASGVGSVLIDSSQIFTVNSTGTPMVPVFFGDIAGAGALNITKSGSGTFWFLLGNASHTGGTTVGSGISFHIGDANDPATTGSITGDIVNNGLSVVFNRRDGITYAGSISGTGQVAKTVVGDLTFTGTNTYSGITSVSAGRLIAGSVNTLSPNSVHYVTNTGVLQLDYSQAIAGLYNNGTVNLANSSVLTIGNAAGHNFSGVIQGDGSLVKSSTGTQILSGDNTFTGTTIVTGGTLQLGNGGTTGSVAGGLSVSGAGSLAINRSDNLSLGISITGTGGLTKSGTGTLTLTGANTHSGTTNITAGTLIAGALNTLSANSSHSVGAGTTLQIDYDQAVAALSSNGTINMADGTTLTVGNGNGVFSGIIQGNGSLVKAGTGNLTLTGNNTFTGSTTVTAGILQLGAGGTTGSVAGTLSVSGAGGLAISRTDNLTLAIGITGTGALTKIGSGTLTLTGTNTHSGTTGVGTGGTIVAGALNTLSPNSLVSVTGTLRVDYDQTVKGFSGGAVGQVVLGAGTVLTSTGGASFLGQISGIGNLAVTGGIQGLVGVSSFSGGVNISGTGAKLRLGNVGSATHSASIANTTTTVSNFGELTGNGTAGAVIVDLNGVMGPGFAGTGTMASGSNTWNSGGILRFQINDALGTAGALTGWDLLSISGSLTINAAAASPFVVSLESLTTAQLPGAVANFLDVNSYAWKIVSTTGGITGFDPLAFTFDSDGIAGLTNAFTNPPAGTFSLSQSGNDLYLNYTGAAIPEPSTYALGAGLLGFSVILMRRIRRNPRFILGFLTGACALFCDAQAETERERALLAVLTDGKVGMAKAPARDQVLWHYRLGATALRAQDWAEARMQFDAAIATLSNLAVNVKSAADARSMFGKEAAKLFIGEPYERAMAYFYRGLIYWHDGELDNARACFRSMAIIDSDTVENQYTADWNLADWLDGAATDELGGDGSEARERAAGRLGRSLEHGRVLVVIEFGAGPQKYATGAHRQQLRFYAPIKQATEVRLTLGDRRLLLAAVDDLHYQATTRGGRVMDHILGNKAQFKDKAGRFGEVAMAGGAAVAAMSSDRDVQGAAGIVALVGLVSYLASASANPTADVRMWENLPRYLTIAWLDLPPGRHTGVLEPLLDGQPSGKVPFAVEIPDTAAPIIFLSDARY